MASKIDRMSMKYTKIFLCRALQNLPKLGFLVCKICHLATLCPKSYYLLVSSRVTRRGEFSPIGRLFTLGSVFYDTSSPIFRRHFPKEKVLYQFRQKMGCATYIAADFFHKLIWSLRCNLSAGTCKK
jgi:hypothetical protein